MKEEKEVMRKRTLKIKGGEFLRHLATYDPALAEEIATSDRPLEQIIAEEITFAKLIKHKALAEMDIETLLVAFDFWNKVMERALQYFTNANALFMMNFLNQYEYVANAVSSKIGNNNNTPSVKEMLMMQVLQMINEARENIKKLSHISVNKEYTKEDTKEKDEEDEGEVYTLVIGGGKNE